MKLLKNFISISVILILFRPLSAQVIETVPAFPTEDQPITIIFDASEAERSDLEGYTGEVYAHTGVIVSEQDRNTGTWSYVKTDWGENTPETRLTSLGNDRWQLDIENIREYYGVPASNRIYQIAILFRSDDTSRQTEDLFIDIFEDELLVRFSRPAVSPPNPFFADLNSDVEFEIVGISPDGTLASITLFEGNNEIASISNSDTLRYDYTVTSSGRSDFRAVAEDGSGNRVEDELYIIVNPEVTLQARPHGIEDGITYHEDGSTVTFSLFAPSKEFVYVIGDHSDWEVREEYFMKRDFARSDSVHYWLTIEDFTPGEAYRFQYLIDGEIRTADLFSELVLHPSRDQGISSSVYPNMPSYPQGLTTEYVTVIHPGREAYQWQVTDFERPPVDELVVYELLLRDFVEESTYTTLRDTLGYLERLGVNVVELMPVQEFDGNLSWGYNPVFHGALDKSYGTRRAFKEFVDEAHRRGMAVVLDVVYNHAQDDSPLIRTFGTNRVGSNTAFSAGNPLLGPGHAYNVFFHLNHDHPYIKYWLDRMNRYWLETYNIDGYRFDLTKGFASNVNNQALLDGNNPRRIANLKRMYDAIREYDEDAYIILEHFAANSEERELEQYGMLLWGNHNFNYSEGVMGWNQGGNSDMSGIYFRNRGFENPHLIGYMESHDEQWLMHKAANFGNQTNPDYDVRELDVALQRMKLAASFFFTIPGPKMLWQFGELGYGYADGECVKPGDGSNGDCRPQDPGRTAEKPVRWEYYNEENRNRVYRSYGELTRLRNTSPVFTSRDTEFSSQLRGSTKWIRLEHPDMDAVIIGNFGVTESEKSVEFPRSGEWFEFVTGTSDSFDSATADFFLFPGEFRIYTSERVEPAEPNVFFPVGDDGFGTVPEEFKLNSNFPNPFNPTTQIEYEVPQEAALTIRVYDMLGREVALLVNEEAHRPGRFTVTFDGSSLSSGVYIARLVGGGTTSVEKMTLIK